LKNLSNRALNITPSITLGIDAKAKQLAAQGAKVINFGVGEPDFNTPENIAKAAVAALHRGETRYTPASGTEALRQAICAKLERENGLSYTPGQIVVSNGAKHSLYNALLAICDPGDEVLLPVPYWVSYAEMIKMVGAVPVFLPTKEENDFKLCLNALEAAITPRTKALMLNSPSNPTGMVYHQEELAGIAAVALRHDLYVISDEIYEKLVYDHTVHTSIAALGPEIKERTIVINGMSKAYAMTGWRIGYTASSAPIARAMGGLQSHATSNPNSIAQAASIEALIGPQHDVQMMVGEFAKRRLRMVELLSAVPGISCRTPQGAFYVMANISRLLGKNIAGREVTDDVALTELLLEKVQVAVVPGSGFGDGHFLRLSYATSMENIEEGMRRIGNLLA